MLTEICQYLHNWFDRDQEKYYGSFVVADGRITNSKGEEVLIDGQYFRIVGSLLNDGVYQYPNEGLQDESFDGAIWSMALPPALLALSGEIEAWQEKYGSVGSVAMSPYNSESFGGYSYSKSGITGTEGADGGWQGAFKNRLASWRKLP